MNQIVERTERLPMDAVGLSTSGSGSKIAPQNLGEVVKFAEVMSRADIALPKHLRGNAGACMAVALQALDWQMNPFAVASKSYSVNGTIAYEAQLIVAVVNTRSGIEGRITYRFEGEGADRVCFAMGKLDGEVLEVKSPRFADIHPKNSPLWKSDPDQQQCYYTGRSWARRFTPEVILGVYDRDEVESFRGPEDARDVTPSVMERLQAAQNATERTAYEVEGFSAAHVQRETASVLTGEIFIADTDDALSLPASGSDDEPTPPARRQEDAAELTQPSPTAVASSPSIFSFADGELVHLRDFARKALKQAGDGTLSEGAKLFDLEGMEHGYRGKAITSDDGLGALNAMIIAINAVISGKRTKEQSAAYIARELIDCDVSELGGRSNG